MAIITNDIITFSGLSDLQAYIKINGAYLLSNKTLVLNTNPDATDVTENTYSLNDIFPEGNLDSPINIVVGSGTKFTDDWSKVYSDLFDPANPVANISSITLQAGSIFRNGFLKAYPSGGVLQKTDINFGNDVSVDNPAYIEGVYYPDRTKYGTGSLSEKKINLNVKEQKLLGYTNNFYDPTKSAVQFRVVDEEGKLIDSDTLKYKINYKATSMSNDHSNNADALGSGKYNIPTYHFDESIGDVYAINKFIQNQQLNDIFFGSNNDSYQCFLEGTEIKTLEGWKKVEDICANDEIITYIDGNEITKQVAWVGRTLLNSRNNIIILIKQNAFGDNIPYKDLYVTPEHCLFIDNYFIPVRMLVNNRSICQKIIENKFVYHIQLKNHSVINAHGVMTESFLNTHNFNIKLLGNGNLIENQSWEKDAAYPLNTQRDFVERIYKNIEEIAIQQGFEKTIQPVKTTKDPCVEFIDSNNMKLPFVVHDHKYILYVKPNIESIMIKSKASKPSEVIGPFVDDRRTLGILIGDIIHITKNEHKNIQIPINDYNWYSNNGNLKWTNGKSEFKLEAQSDYSIVIVDLIAQNEAYIA